MNRSDETLSLTRARRIALAATGLSGPRPVPTRPAVARGVERLGLLQIDSVTVLARAHLLPLYSRLGTYDVADLDRLATGRRRRLVECWAHEASLVPTAVYHELAWWRQEAREQRWARRLEEQDALARDIVAVVREEGPCTARDIQTALGVDPLGGGWWNHSDARRLIDVLFILGDLACADRTTSFERRYDLPDRAIPAPSLETPTDPADAQRALVLRAARALGIATGRCLRDYYRLSAAVVDRAVERLVEEEELRPVTVPGWGRAYLAAGAREPRTASGRALLAPFDPLVFERSRLLALFGMHYRIGIYTPAPKRTHGYYVLPFLLGGELVARVDLKTDRARGRLLVREAHLEPVPQERSRREAAAWPTPSRVAEELLAELTTMADWLGLETVVVDEDARGDLPTLLPPAG